LLWGLLLILALGSILVPLDGNGRVDFAQWAEAPSAYFSSLPAHGYQLIKTAILWAPVGFLYTLVVDARVFKTWVPLSVLALLALGMAMLPAPGFRIALEAISAIPGLALGVWLASRTNGALPTFTPKTLPSAPDAVTTPQVDDAPKKVAAYENPVCFAKPGLAGRATALLLAAGGGLSLFQFPLIQVGLAIGLALYGVLLWRFPSVWLVAIPAALPLLDLAPWTGRFFWDEFDLLMLTTLAVGVWQGQFRTSAWQIPKLRGLLAVFVLITCVSLMMGLFPLQAWDANALSAYWSHYNSLRLAKGLLWGLVFYGLYRSLQDRDAAFVKLAGGMALGVLGVSAWALWEQMQFAGAATTADYRVTGSFSSMHTGGGHFEAYLVMALPFVWGLFFVSRNRFVRGVIAAIFLLGAYALFSTVARGGALALGLALFVLTAGTWRALGRQSRHRARFATPALLGVLTLAVMIAGASGVFWKQRIAKTVPDAGIRLHHWSEVLDMRDSGWMTALFGQGLGSLPATNLASQLPDQAGSYRYAEENGNPYLALNSAGTLYMAQRVAPRPAETLTLNLSARAPAGSAGLEASLCEKSLFNSRQCQWLKLDVKPGTPGWQTFRQTFSSGEVGAGNVLTRRPVQFSLYNPVPGTVIEVDNIRLLDAGGENLVKNGDFSQGGDFWFFKSGDHLFWHAKNLWVHLLFEHGWLGALLFSAIMVLALVRLARPVIHGALEPTVWLAALAALATVGMVDSLVDAPRLALLVYGVLFVGAAWGTAPKTHAVRPKRSRHRSHSHLRAEPKGPVV